MTKILCQDLIEKFYQDDLRRSIRVSAKQFNRTENKNKGVAKATPKKKR